jgi:hypothetical protein
MIDNFIFAVKDLRIHLEECQEYHGDSNQRKLFADLERIENLLGIGVYKVVL